MPGRPAEAAKPCPHCGGNLPGAAVLCTSCGFDLRTGKRLKVARDRQTSAEADTSEPEQDHGPLALRIVRALLLPWYARLLKSPATGMRRHGLWQVLVGCVGIVVWCLLFIVAFSALQAAFPTPKGPPDTKAASKAPGFLALPFFLLFFPVGWSIMLLTIGLFHAIFNVPFSRLNNWWNSQPVWKQIASLPVILVVVFGPLAGFIALIVLARSAYRMATG